MITFEQMKKKIVVDLRVNIFKEYEKIVLAELGDKIINNLMNAYDGIVNPMDVGRDPADPADSEARTAFEVSLWGSLKKSLKSKPFAEAGKSILSYSTGDEGELGYDMESGEDRDAKLRKRGIKNPSPLYWLIFYLEGVAGEYYFVSEDDFERFAEAGLKSVKSLNKFKTWGWYGEGFLIPAKEYRKQGFHKVPGVKAKLHPFSGTSPSELFESALEGINMRQYFARAIERATKRM